MKQQQQSQLNEQAIRPCSSTCRPNLAQKRGSLQLWQFLLKLLETADSYKHIIEWTKKSCAEFKLLDPEEVARLWGVSKNRPTMNYDKLSRSLRYYYEKGIMQKVAGERYVYRFINQSDLYQLLPELAELCQQSTNQIVSVQGNIKPRSTDSHKQQQQQNVTPKLAKSMNSGSHRYVPYAKSRLTSQAAAVTINNLNYEITNCNNYTLPQLAANQYSADYISSQYYPSASVSSDYALVNSSVTSSSLSSNSPSAAAATTAIIKTSTPNLYQNYTSSSSSSSSSNYSYYNESNNADYYNNCYNNYSSAYSKCSPSPLQGISFYYNNTPALSYSAIQSGYTTETSSQALEKNCGYDYHRGQINYAAYSNYNLNPSQTNNGNGISSINKQSTTPLSISPSSSSSSSFSSSLSSSSSDNSSYSRTNNSGSILTTGPAVNKSYY